MSVVLVGAAPAGLSPDLRERFAAGLAAHKAGDWATAGREFADPAWAGTPLEDYALLFQAEAQLRQGDVVAARALATQAADRTPESLTPSALVRAAAVRREAGDPTGAVTTLQRVLTRLADAPDAARVALRAGRGAARRGGPEGGGARVPGALAAGARRLRRRGGAPAQGAGGCRRGAVAAERGGAGRARRSAARLGADRAGPPGIRSPGRREAGGGAARARPAGADERLPPARPRRRRAGRRQRRPGRGAGRAPSELAARAESPAATPRPRGRAHHSWTGWCASIPRATTRPTRSC